MPWLLSFEQPAYESVEGEIDGKAPKSIHEMIPAPAGYCFSLYP